MGCFENSFQGETFSKTQKNTSVLMCRQEKRVFVMSVCTFISFVCALCPCCWTRPFSAVAEVAKILSLLGLSHAYTLTEFQPCLQRSSLVVKGTQLDISSHSLKYSRTTLPRPLFWPERTAWPYSPPFPPVLSVQTKDQAFSQSAIVVYILPEPVNSSYCQASDWPAIL